MSSNTATAVPMTAADAAAQGESLLQHVQGLIDVMQANDSVDERRNRDRFPIPYTFRLTPIDHNGNPKIEDTTTIVGKDLSLTGIGFSHDYELTFRRVIISLNHPKVGRFAVEAEIVWTRPTPIGLFESGCRLLRTVSGHTLLPSA